MFDTPILPRLATILAEVKSGDLVVPAFQRPFVWDDDRRLSLLDSIAQGMPIGSLLVWRTNRRDLETYPSVGGVRLGGVHRGDEKINYLMDGHQRISTLFGALYAGPREPANAEDDTRWPLYYELGAKDRPAFRVPRGRGPVPDHWLPLDKLLDGDELFEFTQRLRQENRRDLAKEAESLANVFRDYIIPIVPLVTEQLDTVTDAFVRINSQGKGMTEAHMLRALTHLKDIDTDGHFNEVRERLTPFGWATLDDQVLVNILKALLGLDVYAAGVREMQEMLLRDPKPLQSLGDHVVEAVGFLARLGVRGPAALPYAYQLVTLAALAARFPGRLDEDRFRNPLESWFWATTYTEYFTGITGNRIRSGIEDLARDMERETFRLVEQLPPVKVLTQIRMSSVRARAYLLFLAQLPRDPAARRRRQERLASGDARAVPSLFPGAPGTDPANRVIADPSELRDLRDALIKGRSPFWNIDKAFAEALTRPQNPLVDRSDEFAIPDDAVFALPDERAFLHERGAWLRAQERVFIGACGLRLIDDD